MNIVKEHINFQRGLDPKDAMNIGDVQGRKIEKAYREIVKAVKELAKENKIEHTEWPYETTIGLGFTLDGVSYFIDYDIDTEQFGAGAENPAAIIDYKHFLTVRECMEKLRNWIYR